VLRLQLPGGHPLDTRLELDAAFNRANRQLELAADPDHGGQVSHGSLQEAHVILALIASGGLRRPVVRTAGRGDCTDGNQQDWDVKRPRDTFRPQFDVDTIVEKIRREVICGENVILDLTGLTDSANRRALREAVDRAGLAAHVRWYE
jgi:hypothetical protein